MLTGPVALAQLSLVPRWHDGCTSASVAASGRKRTVMYSFDVVVGSRCYSSLGRQVLLGMWLRETNAMRRGVAATEGTMQTRFPSVKGCASA